MLATFFSSANNSVLVKSNVLSFCKDFKKYMYMTISWDKLNLTTIFPNQIIVLYMNLNFWSQVADLYSKFTDWLFNLLRLFSVKPW